MRRLQKRIRELAENGRWVGTQAHITEQMADNVHRCLFEMEDGSFCMEAVAAQGLQCHLHTRVPVVAVATEFRDTPIRCMGHYISGRRAGQRCTNNVYEANVHTCGLHRRQEGQQEAPAAPVVTAPIVPEGVRTCPIRVRTGKRAGQTCGRACNALIGGAREEHVCKIHLHSRIAEIQRIQDNVDNQAATAVLAQYNLTNVPLHTFLWRMGTIDFEIYSTNPDEAMVAARRRAEATYQRNRQMLELQNNHVNWLAEILNQALTPLPGGTLGRFVHDKQNVHTPETNKIVADANVELEKVEAIEKSLTHIKERFNERNFATTVKRKEVYNDMRRFYKSVGEYQTTLDKVWGLIQTSKHKDDLEQRLWEEAVDSLGMCTQGHIARLANVLQGFDEAEAPKLEIPKGERLQTAMAQINELPQNERESAARRVFAELEVTEGEQGAWLEALEVA